MAVSPDGRYAAVVIENERNETVGDGLIPQGRITDTTDPRNLVATGACCALHQLLPAVIRCAPGGSASFSASGYILISVEATPATATTSPQGTPRDSPKSRARLWRIGGTTFDSNQANTFFN